MSDAFDAKPQNAVQNAETAQLMEQILYEVKRIVVGQDKFLERVMVAISRRGICWWRVCRAWPKPYGENLGQHDSWRFQAHPIHPRFGASRLGGHAYLQPKNG